MAFNIKLWYEIKLKFGTQKKFAKAVGEHHTRVSQVVNGHVNLSDRMANLYAEKLGVELSEIF